MIHIQGDGGHAKVVKDALGDRGDELVGLAVIAVGDNKARKKEAARLAAEGYGFWTVISPLAHVSKDVHIGEGTVVMAGVIVQPGAWIGRHVILNTNCSVDHGCRIEDFAHIAPGVNLCGDVHVGEGALVGVGNGITPGAKIPAWSLVKPMRPEIV